LEDTRLILYRYHALRKFIFSKKDARKRVIKFIPYQVSITFTFMFSILIIKAIDDSHPLANFHPV
jgi:hypothetical protein